MCIKYIIIHYLLKNLFYNKAQNINVPLNNLMVLVFYVYYHI